MRTFVVLLALVACSGRSTDTDTDTDAGVDTSLDEPLPDGTCARWNRVREYFDQFSWTGSVEGCVAGDISAIERRNTLLRVNLYREMAGLSPVQLEATRNQKAQECALMMRANNALSHTPPASWTCYSAAGAEGAGNSNIATSPTVTAVDGYISDFGDNNWASLGHRRWVLSNSVDVIGVGSTDQHSCLWVLGGSGTDRAPWTAWPPPGELPYEAATMVDTTGWSVQSDTISFNAATITVRVDGVEKPVSTRVLSGNPGSNYGIAWVPSGWRSERATTVDVEINGVSPRIAYTVDVLDCRGG